MRPGGVDRVASGPAARFGAVASQDPVQDVESIWLLKPKPCFESGDLPITSERPPNSRLLRNCHRG